MVYDGEKFESTARDVKSLVQQSDLKDSPAENGIRQFADLSIPQEPFSPVSENFTPVKWPLQKWDDNDRWIPVIKTKAVNNIDAIFLTAQ